MSVREPILKPVAIADLRPTQMTIGIREVKEKRKRWREEDKKKGAQFLGKHMIPVVLGRRTATTSSIIITWPGRCLTKASKIYWLPW
jgi:hypothetical protein